MIRHPANHRLVTPESPHLATSPPNMSSLSQPGAATAPVAGRAVPEVRTEKFVHKLIQQSGLKLIKIGRKKPETKNTRGVFLNSWNTQIIHV